MVHFLGNASHVIHQIINYGSQIGLWMSSAFLVQRMTTVFVWDGLIAGISNDPVPRLPKDVTGLCIFGVAVIGIVATVFDKSVTGIWGNFRGSQYRNWNSLKKCNSRCFYWIVDAC